jgi:sugar phosphate isomerase/epimerase
MKNLAVLMNWLFLILLVLGCRSEHNNNTPSSDQVTKDGQTKNKLNNNNEIDVSVKYGGKYKFSLAQWSVNKQLFNGTLDNLDFAKLADSLGFEGVEYVNQFFMDKAEDLNYLKKMKTAALKAGIESLLIMVDGEGDLASTNEVERKLAVENHFKWVNAAAFLGCHSIRVNLFGTGNKIDTKEAAIKSLTELSLYAVSKNINILVENHGGYSSDGKWLSSIIKEVNLINCGTLPDFGNFCLMREGGKQWGAPCIEEYSKYEGVEELMPFAKGVSAKSFSFNDSGEETTIDYNAMLDIVRSSGYTGYIGVEFEGEDMNAIDGILATKKLLERY